MCRACCIWMRGILDERVCETNVVEEEKAAAVAEVTAAAAAVAAAAAPATRERHILHVCVHKRCAVQLCSC
jgi:hypothetical protein